MELHDVRLGHSLGDKELAVDEDALELAVHILLGRQELTPREPRDAEAVLLAEKILGADPRPIYAYVGDLHPDLGSVGLVISRTWSNRTLQGVTRCDSGGLANGIGCFVHIEERSRTDMLLALSSPRGFDLEDWEALFVDEVGQSYKRGCRDYIDGEVPDTSAWDDARAHCIAAARAKGPELDRRLWTWEARMQASPRPDEFVALVLSHDAQKRLHVFFTRDHIELPEHVKVLAGNAGPHALDHWFSAPAVREMLLAAEEVTS